MPRAIGAEELKTLVDEGAQLIEVLPPREYEEEHLLGAINFPLKSFTPDNLSNLDRRRPVLRPKAAAKPLLERMKRKKVPAVIVTTKEGRLIGAATQKALQQLVERKSEG